MSMYQDGYPSPILHDDKNIIPPGIVLLLEKQMHRNINELLIGLLQLVCG